MVKRVLMIAYHFPPLRGASGVQRTLCFARYLAEFGWQPLVLTVKPSAYASVDPNGTPQISNEVQVVRTAAFDVPRHLSIRGKYPGPLALPDQWSSWWFSALPRALRLCRTFQPQLIWSSYPIATAHLIGLSLARLTGIPWVADFRDSMVDELFPYEPLRRGLFRWIESHSVARCRRAVFTTPGAVRMYAERYPNIPPAHWQMLANGYDENTFRRAETDGVESKPNAGAPIRLLHSGLLYPQERDPEAFFAALATLKRSGKISAARLTVVLRATGHDEHHRGLLDRHGVSDLVRLAPGIGYQAALREMIEADGLLIFQAANCNHQIPAKAYEYLRARRPVLALTDPAGDTASLLRDAGIDTIAPLDDAQAIATAMGDFLDGIEQGSAPLASEAIITSHSRRERTAQLARLFDEIVADQDGR